jgi:arginine decarboxylase
MDNGVDNCHQSWQGELTAMELFAEAVGADQMPFSTNGSTDNVHGAMMTVVTPGDTLVMARRANPGYGPASARVRVLGAGPQRRAAGLRRACVDDRWQVTHRRRSTDLERVLDEHPQARAAMVFTPSYYGVSADVKNLADVCHAPGIRLPPTTRGASTTASRSKLPAAPRPSTRPSGDDG